MKWFCRLFPSTWNLLLSRGLKAQVQEQNNVKFKEPDHDSQHTWQIFKLLRKFCGKFCLSTSAIYNSTQLSKTCLPGSSSRSDMEPLLFIAGVFEHTCTRINLMTTSESKDKDFLCLAAEVWTSRVRLSDSSTTIREEKCSCYIS